MSERRKDLLEDRWVLVAADRARRPRHVPDPRPEGPDSRAECPFCPGREGRTRPEILRLVRPDGAEGAWTVRVVPNYYPMLQVEAEAGGADQEWFTTEPGLGAHEVIVEIEDHHRELADLEEEELARVVHAWRQRVVDLRGDARLRQVLIFKNRGALAGATVPHAHSQLVALPDLPPRHAQRLRCQQRHFQRTGEALLPRLLAEELQRGERVVEQADGFVCLAPFASAQRYELLLAPETHQPFFRDLDQGRERAFGAMLGRALRRIRLGLGDPAFNLMLYLEPHGEAGEGAPEAGADHAGDLPRFFQWHAVLAPRLHPLAGFEWGGGLSVNTTPPEEAARHLRSVDPDAPWPTTDT